MLPKRSAVVGLPRLLHKLQPALLVHTLPHMAPHPLAVRRSRIARALALGLLREMRTRLRRVSVVARIITLRHLPSNVQEQRPHPANPLRHVPERGVRADRQRVTEAQQPHLHKRRLHLVHGLVLTPLHITISSSQL
jgi:hypothetical protein